MRKRNMRLVMVGLVMIALAAAFFFGMATIAGKSTDPVEMMKTVGQVSGVVAGLGVAILIYGLIGRKVEPPAA
jgi:hypothetical protein